VRQEAVRQDDAQVVDKQNRGEMEERVGSREVPPMTILTQMVAGPTMNGIEMLEATSETLPWKNWLLP